MKYFLKVIGAGVCIGILLAVVKIVFQIDDAVFRRAYWIVGTVVILGAMLLSVLYTSRCNKRLRAAIVHYEKGETDIYMGEIEDMLRTAKGRTVRNTLKIDLSSGYYAKGEYDKAIGILEEMSHEPLPGMLKMAVRLNLCLCYFRISRNDKALELYHAGEKEFARYRKNENCCGDFALLDMLAAIAEGRYSEAEELLAHARQTWDSPRLQKEYRMVEETLEKGKG